jgi:hypothetical protein
MHRRNLKSAEVVMKTECLFACIVAVSVSIVGCAKKEGEEPLTPASGEVESSSSPESAPAAEPRQCASNEDCGPGYSCGFDPSVSHVVRVCMAE